MQGTVLGSVDSQDRHNTNPQMLVTSDEGTVTSDTLSTLPHGHYGQCLTGGNASQSYRPTWLSPPRGSSHE